MKIAGVNVLIGLGDLLIIGEEGGVSLVDCTILESLEHPVPTCILTFDADDTFLSDYPIADGTPVDIHVYTDDSEFSEKYKFRVYNLKLQLMNHYIRYTLTCLLDVYPLFLSGDAFAANTISSEIFKNVATTLKLDYNIDTTQDKQLWVPSDFNLEHWLTNISYYGYINDLSCMIWGLDRTKKLLYKDLSSIIKQNPKEKLPKLVPSSTNDTAASNTYAYNVAQPAFNSGIENLQYRGYGGYDTYFDFSSYSSKKCTSQKVVLSSNMLNINKELSKGLNATQLAMNVGNFHPHYYDAYMQNLRQLSTYSTYMTVLMEVWVPTLHLLDPVLLDYSISGMSSSAESDKNIVALSSVYVIDKITTTITAGTFSQGLQLMGQGYNTSNSTETY